MKAKPKTRWILGFVFGAVLQLHSQGYIVPNGIVSNYGGLFFPGEIDVLHDPANPTSGSSYTGFIFRPQGPNTFRFDPVLDVGVRVFLVSLNDSISLQPILAHSYTEPLNPNSYVFNSGSPFYVGLFTGNQNFAPPDGIYTDPLFGWAKLVNNQGVIQLLDSALVYKAEGIYTGTFNIIPEPSSFALGILGAVLFGMCRRSSASLAKLV